MITVAGSVFYAGFAHPEALRFFFTPCSASSSRGSSPSRKSRNCLIPEPAPLSSASSLGLVVPRDRRRRYWRLFLSLLSSCLVVAVLSVRAVGESDTVSAAALILTA